MPEEPEELEDPNDPCWKFTVGFPSEMEFYSPFYPENYPSKIDCLKVIEGEILLDILLAPHHRQLPYNDGLLQGLEVGSLMGILLSPHSR